MTTMPHTNLPRTASQADHRTSGFKPDWIRREMTITVLEKADPIELSQHRVSFLKRQLDLWRQFDFL